MDSLPWSRYAQAWVFFSTVLTIIPFDLIVLLSSQSFVKDTLDSCLLLRLRIPGIENPTLKHRPKTRVRFIYSDKIRLVKICV